MNEHLFLKGQHTIGDNIIVKLDNGDTQTFPSGDLRGDTSAG